MASNDDSALIRWLGYSPRLNEIADVELLTLKLHVVAEDALRHLLAMRLGVTEAAVRGVHLGFETLANLALAGDSRDTLLDAALALNAARNGVAHRLDGTKFHENIADFLRIMRELTDASDIVDDDVSNRLRDAGDSAIFQVFERASKYWPHAAV
jgi:hypothetical protein